MRFGTFGIGKGDALRDQPARARRPRRGNQIGGAVDAQMRIARERITQERRIENLRQIGELMDHDVRARRHDGIA